MELNTRQKILRGAHLFKALCRQHHKTLEPLLAPYIPADAVVFDVGGHAGQFAKLFSRMAPQGAVFVFEPASYARSVLQAMAGLKRLDNIYILPLGLGASAEQRVLNVPVKKKGNVGFGLSYVGDPAPAEGGRFLRLHRERVFISTVDHMVQVLGLQRLDFIKADIEGFELFMLHGARETLKRLRPALLLELSDHALVRHGQSVAEARAFLRDLGYAEQRLEETAGRIVPVSDDCRGGDFLFTPRA